MNLNENKLGWSLQVAINNGIEEVVDWIDGNINSLSNESLDYIHMR